MEGSKYDDYRYGIVLFLYYVQRKSEILHFENHSKSSKHIEKLHAARILNLIKMIWSQCSTFLVWCALVVLKRIMTSMEY